MAKVENREYSSSAFSLLFREPEYAPELYNCLNGSEYTDESLVEICVLENGITLSVRNDASFIVNSVLNLLEHQSTYNPNMPLRNLIYVTELYKRLTKRRDLFGRNRIELPEPEFVVFYTGMEKRPAVEVMKLSDSFAQREGTGAPVSLELRCVVYNLNTAENREKFAGTASIRGFLIFINKVREYWEQEDDRGAVDSAITYCISHGILADFFRRNREEITRATMIDMTYERRMEIMREEAEEEKRSINMTYERRMEIMREEAEEEKRSINMTYEKRMEIMREEAEEEKRSINMTYEKRMEIMREEAEEEKRSINMTYEKRMEIMREEAEEEKQSLSSAYEARLEAMRNEAEAEKKEASDTAYVQGVDQGKTEEKMESILMVLAARGTVSRELEAYVREQRDLDRLKQMFQSALRAASVKDFEQEWKVRTEKA